VTEFPPLDDELRPKVRLKKHADVLPTTDEEIEANSRRIGEKWGATTKQTVWEWAMNEIVARG
jgi:hypothetical protein